VRTIVYDHQIFSLQPVGGISRYFCELALRVSRADGFGARVIAPLHFNHHLAECGAPKTALYLPKPWKAGPLFRCVNRWLSPGLTDRVKPALIHRTFFGLSERPRGVPVVVTVFDMINELFPQGFAASDTTARDKRLAVVKADHVLCISQCTADDVIRLLGVSPAKVSVTHLGCSESFSEPAPEDETSPHPRPYLLFVGHRAGHKNFDGLLSAYAASARLHSHFDLVAFGGLPFSRGERDRVASLGLSPDRVLRWSGPDTALARAYRHARALVYPSKYEGFGIPPLEAMSAGCAVACSDRSSIPEVVGQAARLFDPGQLDSIRCAVEAIAFSDAERVALIAAGRRRVLEFSWDRCAQRSADAYRKLIASST
jgi:glycosyltransferase involved in cell wall biosynthesis